MNSKLIKQREPSGLLDWTLIGRRCGQADVWAVSDQGEHLRRM